jgi:TfoX/Sxy family transcriptional regulator of competence genes
MSYNEQLADRIRKALAKNSDVTEKKMFGGLAFMVKDKMCVGVDKDDLMLRCAPEMTDELLSKKGVRIFDLTGKPMKGWLLVSSDGYKTDKQLDGWIERSLDFASSLSDRNK